MTSLNIFCSGPYDFLKEVTQSKKGKKHIRKILGPLKIFKDIS